jgi:putative ABC transport system permease protein
MTRPTQSLVWRLALRNLVSDWFATICAILGVALGTATVDVVLILDENTRSAESSRWSTNPEKPIDLTRTVRLTGFLQSGERSIARDAGKETHEDYQVMRSAIRLGSLSAFLVGALIVFFTFRVVVVERRREIALLRSLGTLPSQVARIFLLEAAIVGGAGAAIGFTAAPPLAIAAAAFGITTTGRSTIALDEMSFPWRTMLAVSAVGAVTAMLGVARPLADILRLDVARNLRPQFLEDAERFRLRDASRASGLTLIALPFMILLYILIRPFFREVLPSLAFFVLESGAVTAAFLAMLVLVPEIVRVLGGAIARILPQARTPKAPWFLVHKRIDRAGRELAWSVSGVMLVFALLLSLHETTHALKVEVLEWARSSIEKNAYVFAKKKVRVPKSALERVPSEVPHARFSGRAPWPNAVLAVDPAELAAFARGTGAKNEAAAAKLGRGKAILSTMMARRFGLTEGDQLEVTSARRSARLEIAAVTDDVGYMPMIGPYRNSKTYALISSEDFDLIEPLAAPIGAGVALRGGGGEDWTRWLEPALEDERLRVEIGSEFEADRVAETNRDFAIFDVILFLTAVLATIGIANNLVLAAHARRREIALFRVLGMEARQIKTLFLLEGAFIGALGGGLAVLLGIPLGMLAIGALTVVSAFMVRFELPAWYAILTIAGAIAASLAASLYPALRASRSPASESIHYE